jgi:hypothetical protein
VVRVFSLARKCLGGAGFVAAPGLLVRRRSVGVAVGPVTTVLLVARWDMVRPPGGRSGGRGMLGRGGGGSVRILPVGAVQRD